MKTKLLKNSVKEIKDKLKRFISILLMSFLGVGFFSGLVACGPDMREAIDTYYDASNTYDIVITSTLGLTDEDIKAIQNLDKSYNVYGVNSVDKEITIKEEKFNAKFIELKSEINDIDLVSGKRPENDNECVLDSQFAKRNKYEIGNKIKTEENEYEVVGLAKSPLYITSTRGTTNIGTGTINCFIYINKIEQDYYTNIYVTSEKARDDQTSSNEYNKIITEIKNKINSVAEERENARYNEIKERANSKIEDARKELQSKKDDAYSQINEGKEEIKNAELQISKAKKEIANNKQKLTEQKQSVEKQFESAENKISESEQQLNQAKQGLKQANQGLETIKTNIESCNNNITQLQQTKQLLQSQGKDTTQIDAQIEQLQSTISSLNVEKSNLENQISVIKTQIQSGEEQIQSGKQELEKNKEAANRNFAKAESQISQAEQEIKNNAGKLANSKKELEDKEKEAEQEFNKAEEKIKESEQDIQNIEKPTWYIHTRDDNNGYNTFVSSVKSMENISKVFPLVFYIVAILISLTSMTRMVEEERTEIGTLKALGYNNAQILAKYCFYALSACLIGGLIGMAIGFKFLPSIVWYLYKMLFDITYFKTPFIGLIGILGLGIAIICIVGATIIVCMQELRQTPAVLMRPKTPRAGKKILLEKITFIWKRLKFSQKITARNLFRYKKRGIMTIVGITGCTALITAGFGLKDSITGIVSAQYEDVFSYKEQIIIAQKENSIEEIENIIKNTQDGAIELKQALMKTATIEQRDVNLMIPADNLDSVIHLYDGKTGEKAEMPETGTIAISDKLADILNIKVGDTAKLEDSNGNQYEYKVSEIIKNYVTNYIFMTKETYEQQMGEYKTNALLTTSEFTDETKKQLLENDNVLSMMDVGTLTKSVNDMLKSLDYIIIILIVSAAILAFVVLYNLANINIGERIREIATLKVLGFYNKEVDDYINKESIILTLVGIILGFIGGYALCNFLVKTCEPDMVRFIRHIHIQSYIYSGAITAIFSMIVNLMVHKTLKKVDMISSLKSIE